MASMTRPSRAGPTGTLTTLRVRRTSSPRVMSSDGPSKMTPSRSGARSSTMPCTPHSNSSNSSASARARPETTATPSPTSVTLPTSVSRGVGEGVASRFATQPLKASSRSSCGKESCGKESCGKDLGDKGSRGKGSGSRL